MVGLRPVPFLLAAGLSTALVAQSCDPGAQRTLRTSLQWYTQFFHGPYNFDDTLNLFFDLEVASPVSIDRLWIPTYNQQATSFPPNQVGNIAEVRIYLVVGSWTGKDKDKAAWGFANPGSGEPEYYGELTVVAWPGKSPIENFRDAGGIATPVVLPTGNYGVCVELIPTSWTGTASIPGQTNVPLLNPGALHTVEDSSVPRSFVFQDGYLALRNDAIQGTGWQRVDATGSLVPLAANPGTSVRSNPLIDIDYVPGMPGTARQVPFGSGCYAMPRAVYETFDDHAEVDLQHTSWSWSFQSTGAGGEYVITPGGPGFDLGTAMQSGVELTASPPTSAFGSGWDDGSLVYTLPTSTFPNGLSYPGGSCTEVTINFNGRILLGGTTSSSFEVNGAGDESVHSFRSGLPQLLPLFADFDQSRGGQLFLEDPSPGGGVRMTWNALAHYPYSSQSSFQVELLPSGDLHVAYGACRLGGINNHGLVGFSPGAGAPIGLPIDWSVISSYRTGDGSVPPRLGLGGAPLMGTAVDVVIDDLASGTAAPLGGFLSLAFTGLPSGLSLQPYGLPGCEAHLDLGLVAFSVLLGNTGSGELRWAWNVPVNASGVQLFLQGATFAPTNHNLLGVTVTNGLCVRIGP